MLSMLQYSTINCSSFVNYLDYGTYLTPRVFDYMVMYSNINSPPIKTKYQ